jgi:hypothetical protein
MAIIYLAIGITLCTQQFRYSNTPSYHILLQVAPAWTWGIGYIVAGTLLAAYVLRWHAIWFSAVVHCVAGFLSIWWLFSFILRYLTDDKTTIVNVCSWSVYTYLVVRSFLTRPQEKTTSLPAA